MTLCYIILALVLALPCPALADLATPAPGASDPAVVDPSLAAEPFTPSQEVMNMTDILDIKPVMDPGIGVDWARLAILLGIVALAALLVWFLYRYFKRPRQAEPEPEAHEQAFQALNALSGKELDARLWYFDLSDIARRYIERRFEVLAMEMTSEEFLAYLPGLPLDGELKERVARLVRRWDRSKYAGEDVSRERRQRDLELVRLVVAATVPVQGDEDGQATEQDGAVAGEARP